MNDARDTQPNALLSWLSHADQELFRPHMKRVDLKFRQRLQSANRKIETVYFIESGIASVVAIGRGDRRQAETAVIGREGMTGLPLVLGAERTPFETFMQMEGEGQSISAAGLAEVIGQSGTALACMLRYAHAYSVQVAYTALANATGSIEERLARWLLMTRDRTASDELVITHEFMALMLGVRRAGVSVALQSFESQGLVSVARGSVTILDRDGIEEKANGLYGIPESEMERVFDRTFVKTKH